MMMNDHIQRAPTREALTATQTRACQALRRRYREHQDLFISRELAHLCFLRWLVRTGRLAA